MSNSARPAWNVPIPDKLPQPFSERCQEVHGIDRSLAFIGDQFASIFDGESATTSLDWMSVADAATYAQRSAGRGFWDSLAYTLKIYGYNDLEDLTTQGDVVIANIVTNMGNWARDLYATNPLQD